VALALAARAKRCAASSAARPAGVGTGKPAGKAESAATAGGRTAIRGLRLRREESVMWRRIAASLDDHKPLNWLTADNVERFSLGGAAHGPLREGSVAGIRAGERKTCWANPLAPQMRAMSRCCAAK
jgi:hypothetical protein